MIPPLLSYVTFNRLGLTVKNLSSILNTTDEFDMHIIDNNSTDGTWEYLQCLDDSRIKSKTQIGVNAGQIYSTNINLSKRRSDQYFITIDNDVYIETKDWISRFLKVFQTFPEVGLLGVQRTYPYPDHLPPVIPRLKDGLFYLELRDASPNIKQNFVPGCCQFLRPELINEIGYWSEENCFGEGEISLRVNNYSSFKAGLMTNISIQMPQTIECTTCQYKDLCNLNKQKETCLTIYQKLYKNDEFFKKYKWKFDETLKDMQSGARPVFCASAHDASSFSNHIFNMDWALENFNFYIKNAN